MLHTGQQVGDLPVGLPTEGLDRPAMLPGRLEIRAPRRGSDELQRRGIIKAQLGALNRVAAAVGSQQVASLQQARFAQEDGHAVKFGAGGTCGTPDSQPSVAAGQCGQDLRSRKSNTPGSRKNSVTPINSELTTSATRCGLSLQQFAGSVGRVDLQGPQASRQSTMERLGTVGRGIQSGTAQYPGDEVVQSLLRGVRRGCKNCTARPPRQEGRGGDGFLPSKRM